MLYVEDSLVPRDFLYAITLVVNLYIAGRKMLDEFSRVFSSTLLMSLLKLDGGIWPIIVGFIWRRMVSKVAMKWASKNMARYLNDF